MARRSRRPISRRWIVVSGFIVLAFVLGCIGFSVHTAQTGSERSTWDIVYLALQLFTLESGAVDGPVNRWLQLARFLAPVAAAYAIVLTVLGMFSDELRRRLIGWRAGHVIVCGLGRKGKRLVERLREQQRPVIIVDPDEHNANLHRCRELGCGVIHGRADDPWVLQRASVSVADALIAVAGDDGVNIETAVRARHLVQSRRGKRLHCVVHMADPDLRSIVMERHIFADESDRFEVEFFNTFEVGARVMLEQSGVFDPLQDTPRAPHLVVVGMGRLGEALLRRAVKECCLQVAGSAQSLQVTVIDIEADLRRRWLDLRCPELAQLCRLNFVELDVRTLRDVNGASVADDLKDATAAIVCLDDNAQAMFAGLKLRSLLPPNATVVVRVTEEAGLATLLQTEGITDAPMGGIVAVGLMDIACTLGLVLDGVRETLAQAIHQGYVVQQRRSGQTISDDPALQPWHRLPAELKASNRAQAEAIRSMLQQIGCSVLPDARVTASDFRFAEHEVEQLAKAEHERWLRERQDAGWTWDQRKDLNAKTHPALRPWEELDEDVKASNRAAIRRLPTTLAKADLEIRYKDDGRSENLA